MSFTAVDAPCVNALSRRYRLHSRTPYCTQTEAEGLCQTEYGGRLVEVATQAEVDALSDYLMCMDTQVSVYSANV